ncbi:MAG TPA: Hint domain-containing protein, partial [Thermotogota bacterium]|nr:Hint domain-containing protein [Thermotogota bacterium]
MLKTRIVKKTVKIKQLFDYLKIPEKENFVFSSPIMLNVKTPYGYKKIKNLFRTEKQNSVSIYFKNNKVLETSLNHLLLVNGEWKAVKDIDIENDIIETETGHTKIKHIHEKNKDVMLYDMTVEDVQCYYSSGILSHNSWVLMAIGNHALTLGKTVFHYTLE